MVATGRAKRAQGFTYLGLLFAIVLASTALAAAGSLWSMNAKRDKEAELLFVGQQLRAAIGSYWGKSPGGEPPAFPKSLEALIDDQRWPTTRRHLRRLFADPMTGTAEWGLIVAPGGGVMGVHSLSDAAPLKRANFGPDDADFAEARSYREWRFVFTPANAPSTPRN